MSDSCVYISDKDQGWLPANVISQQGGDATVKVFDDAGRPLGERTVKLKDYPNQQLPLQNVDPSGNLMEMQDMVDLPSLHEAAILYNLRQRHAQKKPYTRVGDLIIAVNPFQWMEQLYSEENRNLYVDKLIYQSNVSNARASLPPHVYETSCMAYRGLAVEGKHQSILVSGESGAGKTETVKIVMRHLSSVSSHAEEDGKAATVVNRVLDGQPLLEAFGNSKTVRNDNSSRFGKFIQMQFDVEDATQAAFSGRAVPNCVLCGSTCETYLLEKSRVVSHEPEERTYHVFYQILAASDDYKQKYMPMLIGKTAADFIYVGHSDTNMIEGMLDGDRFVKTLKALQLLDMTDESLKTLFTAVCCVMQLGNLVFAEDPEDSEQSIISSTDALATCAAWFGMEDKVDAMAEALLNRTVVAGKETYQVPLKQEDARDGCNAFAKEIYQQIFEWLVREINRMTCAEENYDDAQDVEEYGLVGLLDIFGFESFKVNRFEQLCINYTNEKLQQKYTVDIFRSVQEEYSQEGIELGEITFDDNAEVLRLLEGKIGIISVLNEECVRPKGNDTSFVSKVKSVNKEVSCLISEKLHKPKEFAIQHYAGVVKYDATNFVEKNTDALPKDVIELACKSTNSIIQVELLAAAEAKTAGSSSGGAMKRGGGSALTVATKFKSQLTRLMADIAMTNTRYVRCIKPNPQKVPLIMDMGTSCEQLRCAGVVAAVTISRVAFPNRLMHETALERFACLSHVTLESMLQQRKPQSEDDMTGYKSIVEDIFDGLLKNMEETKSDGTTVKAFECGKSRIYFRLGALESLEAQRLVALGTFAICIERIVRGFTARSLYWKLKYAVIDSQANARRVLARKKFIRAQHAAVDLACWIRVVYAKRRLVVLQREFAATRIQSLWRMVAAKTLWLNCQSATITIQKIVRGALQRPKYRLALKEAEEEARVNSKLAALQKRLQEAEMKFFQADKMRIEAEKRAAGLVPTDGAAPVAPIAAAEPVVAPAVAVPAPPTTSTVMDSKDEDGPGSAQQQALIDESNEMLDYFRKEVFKLKSANYLLRTDLSSLQQEHRTLQAHAQSTEASYSAMNKNVARLSQGNMRLAVQLAEEKDFIVKLKKDLKMEKIRASAELKRKTEEVLGRDKMHEAEMARLKRELARLRQIIAQNGGADDLPPEEESGGASSTAAKKVTEQKFERASFQKDPFKASVLRSLDAHKGTSLAKASMDGPSSSSSYAQSSDDDGWQSVGRHRHHRRPPPIFGGRGRYGYNDGYGSGGGPPGGGGYNGRPPPRQYTPLGAAAAAGGRGFGGRGYGGSPRNPSLPPVGYNPVVPTKVNTGTSLGAAVTGSTSNLQAQAKSGSSLAAAATKAPPKSSLQQSATGGSSLSRATRR